MEYTYHYESPLGRITLASDGTALTGLWFDGQAHFAETLGKDAVMRELRVFEAAARWLEQYFSGRVPEAPPPLHVETTEFCSAVYAVLLTIPYGEIMTYGQIAARIAAQRGVQRVSARAVGGAVGRNPISLMIPCHRVVGTDGSLTGYAGGLDKKRWLLALERGTPPEQIGTY